MRLLRFARNDMLVVISELILMKNTTCFFVSDLHGHVERYQKLFKAMEEEQPYALFIGGDLLPSGILNFSSAKRVYRDFIEDVLYKGFTIFKSYLESIIQTFF
jgi:Icc-related predicted phosphoesterase